MRPTVSFYRDLYDTVGAAWLWYERRRLNDEALGAIVRDERVEVHVLWVEGVPAGYAELDLRRMPDIELVYMGLLPEFTGQGLGSYLLDFAIDRAWSFGPQRLWLHTCNHDHPRALEMYQGAGFVAYRTETKIEPDPRAEGWMGPRP
jgi:GNAT superfamily N-acetyltransferase